LLIQQEDLKKSIIKPPQLSNPLEESDTELFDRDLSTPVKKTPV